LTGDRGFWTKRRLIVEVEFRLGQMAALFRKPPHIVPNPTFRLANPRVKIKPIGTMA
jgi:hypothetical protein